MCGSETTHSFPFGPSLRGNRLYILTIDNKSCKFVICFVLLNIALRNLSLGEKISNSMFWRQIYQLYYIGLKKIVDTNVTTRTDSVHVQTKTTVSKHNLRVSTTLISRTKFVVEPQIYSHIIIYSY